MFGEKTAAKHLLHVTMVQRGGPLLYKDFEEIWAEEAAEKAAKAKADKAKGAEEHRSRQKVMEGPRRPVSFDYKRLPDAEPISIHRPTNLLKHSVDHLDVQYADLSDIERSTGKRAALPRLETLKIRAPREGRSMDDPKIVDDYIHTVTEKYETIRKSKMPDPVHIPPVTIKKAGDISQRFCHDASTKEVVISAGTGAISAAAFAVVYAGVTGFYHQFFA
ncbi:hypothetical protein BZA77DRAFT_366812 [Pyronema omphalodes]|nr:hypothetical protein BZA77DRAFT_366812 [Pyronema omphalodes]